MEKITLDYDGDPSKIKDLARNTIIVRENEIDDVVKELTERGANIKVIDGSTSPLGYSGVNSTIKTKAGIVGEIQVNSPRMIYAKEPELIAREMMGNDLYIATAKKVGIPGGQGHKLYKQWRQLNPYSDSAKSIAESSKVYYESIRGY